MNSYLSSILRHFVEAQIVDNISNYRINKKKIELFIFVIWVCHVTG